VYKEELLCQCTTSKRVLKGLCATEGGEGNIDQDGGGHNIDKASVGNNDRQVRHNFDTGAVQKNGRHVLGQEVQGGKTSDGHNSDNAGVVNDPDSSAAIRSTDMDSGAARGVTRKRNAEDSSFKSRKKGTAGRNESFEGRCKQLIDFIDEIGHCNVPRKFSADPSLGNWYSFGDDLLSSISTVRDFLHMQLGITQ